VDGDPTRLVQVLTNLLTNAAKYTEPGGRIEVAAAKIGDEAMVTVADTGIGIPPDMLPVVFDMFSQVGTSLERSQGGLGIGLTLVRKLVEMHGGTVCVTSAGADRGSTFTVRLPLAAGGLGDAAREVGRHAEPSAATPLKVLIIDDNKDGAASLALFLRLSGHTSRTAHSGPDGIQAANEFRPDVILLDIGLPGMYGFDVARTLRANAAFRDATIVALTGWGSEEDRRKSREAGCDDHLTKPVDADDVKRVLAGVRRR
jgi:CheY-like chemotaxis protein